MQFDLFLTAVYRLNLCKSCSLLPEQSVTVVLNLDISRKKIEKVYSKQI